MPSALHRSRVVIAEPRSATKRQATATFKKRKLLVSSVSDRDSLVNTVATERPALVLLDSAFEKKSADLPALLDALREASPGTPVLMITASSDPIAATEAVQQGATDLLLRPFTTFELGYRVDRCLRAARAATEVAVRAAANRGEFEILPTVRARSLPETPSSDLRDPETGRLDAKRIASYLGIPLTQFAETLGDSYKALHKTPSKASLQHDLLPIERSILLLQERFQDRGRVRAWLNTPHPELGGRAALAVLLEGHAVIVRDMLEAAVEGLPT